MGGARATTTGGAALMWLAVCPSRTPKEDHRWRCRTTAGGVPPPLCSNVDARPAFDSKACNRMPPTTALIYIRRRQSAGVALRQLAEFGRPHVTDRTGSFPAMPCLLCSGQQRQFHPSSSLRRRDRQALQLSPSFCQGHYVSLFLCPGYTGLGCARAQPHQLRSLAPRNWDALTVPVHGF